MQRWKDDPEVEGFYLNTAIFTARMITWAIHAHGTAPKYVLYATTKPYAPYRDAQGFRIDNRKLK